VGITATRSEYDHTADDFVDFFAKKIEIIYQETSGPAPPVFAAVQSATMPQFTAVQPVHVVELIAAAPCKHFDMDPLPTWLLKKCSNIFDPYLAALFNLSLASSVFPTSSGKRSFA